MLGARARYNASMRTHLAVVALCVALGGCQACAEQSEPEGQPRAAATTSASTAVIEGVVHLAEGAELAGWATNPMALPPPRPPVPDACAPPQESDRFPVRLVHGDRLAGVLVTLGDFQTEPPHEPVTHEIVIRDCRLSPALIDATRGDHIRITNETDYPFIPNIRGDGVMRALLHGESRELELLEGGMRPLECAFAAPCGRTDVTTLYHPLHTTTDDEGHFRIEDVPANDELQVRALYYPLFPDQGETLTLQPGETRHIEITLTPAPPEPEPPPQQEPPVDPAILH